MRREGWERMLDEHMATVPAFAWGEHDCALWCADWVNKATGVDFAEKWRGKYKTELGAARMLIRIGHACIADLASATLEECPVPLARRGDIVLNAQGCLGICNGRLSFFITADSVTREETLNCARAWRVG